MTEHEKAKAVLSLPREKYAAMDGAEPQTALQAAWENGRGDAAINACRETGETQFLRA